MLYGLISDGERLGGQAGGEQGGAPVQRQFRLHRAQGGVARTRLVEEAQRGGQVAGLEGDDTPVVHRHRRLEFLALGGEPALGDGEVAVGAGGLAERAVDKEPLRTGPSLPDRVAAPAEQCDRAAQVGQGLVVPAEYDQQVAASHQDPPGQDAGTGRRGLGQHGQPRLGASGQAEGQTEGRADINGPLRYMAVLGQAQRGAKLCDRLRRTPGVAQHDGARLMSDRGIMMVRVLRQQLRSLRQRVPRARQRQRKKALRTGAAAIAVGTRHAAILGIRVEPSRRTYATA
jgi:hypothetical protein